jgi:hypothetical protein
MNYPCRYYLLADYAAKNQASTATATIPAPRCPIAEVVIAMAMSAAKETPRRNAGRRSSPRSPLPPSCRNFTHLGCRAVSSKICYVIISEIQPAMKTIWGATLAMNALLASSDSRKVTAASDNHKMAPLLAKD